MKYCSKITGNGPDAFAFLGDPETNFIIIFNDDAPPALAELCVLHELEFYFLNTLDVDSK